MNKVTDSDLDQMFENIQELVMDDPCLCDRLLLMVQEQVEYYHEMASEMEDNGGEVPIATRESYAALLALSKARALVKRVF